MSIPVDIDPRAVWPLAYLSVRLGYRLAGYTEHGPAKDVISVDLVRGRTEVHVDWFPRTSHILVSQGAELVGAPTTFAALADALDALR